MQNRHIYDAGRQSKRQNLYDLAWFIDPAVDVLVECSVHNMSEGGAMIKTPNAEQLSDFIYMRLRNRPDITECRVKWRSEDSAGIEFVGALRSGA